ncbi:hypothetical protein SAMN05421810_105273 [Amycolatopsis arida]|uniref:Uncharacterized protein n=1 Tax=Amycolatopsis arida TaxID=587909 RepID=A0A1I5WTM9_9PSEU|nr:hypothetical protein CLV69_105292 [Amycolatopsis arida]SFQ23105.1 hypothetical protein SAMN05421810_105273 [Amycolatopsis arida]
MKATFIALGAMKVAFMAWTGGYRTASRAFTRPLP